MITIKIFNTPLEAHVLKSKFESEGISCFLADENTIAMNPLYNYAVSGVKLKVSKDDFESAKNILDSLESLSYTESKEEIVHCPKCNSQNIDNDFQKLTGLKAVFQYAMSLVAMIIPFGNRLDYYCKDCKYVFKKES